MNNKPTWVPVLKALNITHWLTRSSLWTHRTLKVHPLSFPEFPLKRTRALLLLLSSHRHHRFLMVYDAFLEKPLIPYSSWHSSCKLYWNCSYHAEENAFYVIYFCFERYNRLRRFCTVFVKGCTFPRVDFQRNHITHIIVIISSFSMLERAFDRNELTPGPVTSICSFMNWTIRGCSSLTL